MSTRRRRKRTQLSEMVTRRARDTSALVASIRVYKADVAAAFRERFGPVLGPGETLPDYELALELAGRSVQRAFDELDELDDRQFFAKARRAVAACEVERLAKKELYPQAVGVRRLIDDAFGRQAGAEIHGFSGRTPRTPARLEAQTKRMVSGLAAARHRPPVGSGLGGGGVAGEGGSGRARVERWRQRLEEPLRRLAAAGEELGRRGAELEVVRGRRQQAMERFDAVYGESLRLVEGAFVMAGIRGQRLKSLRPYDWRRLLAGWARKKRRARAEGRAVTAAGGRMEVSVARPRWRLPGLGFGAVSKWLKRRRALG